MKNKFFFLFSILFAVFSVLSISSCEDDEIIIDPTDGILVADGMYITIAGEDPESSGALSSETVEDAGFTSQERAGFVAGWVYLEAGNYNIVEVTNKEVTLTLGGVATKITDEASDCDRNDYYLATVSENGAGFNVNNSGLYKVTYDQLTNEVVYQQIVVAGMIGDATPEGWSGDTPLSGTTSAEGATWTAEDVVLRNGSWKIRFNCRWIIDRRLTQDNFLPENGYQIFLNFGGDNANNLQNGNDLGNIPNEVEGTYTIELNWTSKDGFVITLTRTGDAPDLPFDPNDFKFGVIGDATAGGWDTDRNLFPVEWTDPDGVFWYAWIGVITFAESGNFKFRTNDSWDFNLGADTLPSTFFEDIHEMEKGGPDIVSPGAGDFYIILGTSDEGETWWASMWDDGWAVIGDGSPSANWVTDTYLTSEGFADGISTYTLTGDFTTDLWKFRAGGYWSHNLGGGYFHIDYWWS